MPDRRILTIYLAGFIGPLGGNAVLAMLKVLGQEFDAGTTEILLALPFFMFPFALLQFLSGTISDRFERRRLVVGGFAVYGVASLLCAAAPNLAAFMGARVLQGVGFAFVSPVLLAMLGDYTSARGRGLAMGLFGSSITAGTAAGPLVGGVTAEVDWRIAFYLFAGLSTVLAVLFWKGFDDAEGGETVRREVRRFDRAGVILLSAAGFLAFFAFVGATSFTAAVLLVAPHSFTALDVGLVLTFAGVAGVFASPAGGALVDRTGRARTGMLGFGVTAAAILLLGGARGVFQFGLVLFLLGCGTALVWASLNTLTVEIAPRRRGTVASMFNGSRFLGFALAVPILAPVFEAGGVGIVYWAAAASALIALGLLALLSMTIREPREC